MFLTVYFDLSFEETVRRHNTRNREFGEKDMRRWWREKDFSSALREQAITCEMDTDSIVEKIYSDLNADRKAICVHEQVAKLVWLTLISDLLHLYKFPSTALSSIAVATATPHSFAL